MKTEIEIKIRGYHLDVFAHVNNARYLEFLEEARWSNFDDMGISFKKIAERGWGVAIVNINITYKKPASLGQTILVTTEPLRKGTKSITLKQRIFLKGTDIELVEADIKFVVLDMKTGRSIELTPEINSIWESFLE